VTGAGVGQVGRVRVLVYATAADAGRAAVEAAYHTISADLAGTPGLLGNTLMHSVHDEARFVVLSEWADLAAFRSWEAGAAHRQTTSPLRPFQDGSRGSAFGVYEVIAAY
jgi:heme oxygenase (mycobilin-producing)